MTLAALRQLFPHTERTTYLNHAAVSPLSRPVVAAVERFIAERHLTKIENYFDFQPVVEETLVRLARLVGSGADRVEFAPNTSYALNVLAGGLAWQPGDRVALPACEFPANVYPFLNLRRLGVEVDFIPHREGTFDLEAIARTLRPRTRVLSVSWVQFLSGFRVDLAAVGALCRAHDVFFCVDAIQGLGALRLDVEAAGVDFLASGGHKWLMALQGTGFLYVSERLQAALTPAAGWLHGPVDWERLYDYDLSFHADARRYRLGTLNAPGIASLHAALGVYFDAGPAWCEQQVLARTAQLAAGLEALGVARYGAAAPEHASGIVTVSHPASGVLFEGLRAHGVEASLRNGMLRFSPTYYNTPEEIERVLEIMAALLAGLPEA